MNLPCLAISRYSYTGVAHYFLRENISGKTKSLCGLVELNPLVLRMVNDNYCRCCIRCLDKMLPVVE